MQRVFFIITLVLVPVFLLLSCGTGPMLKTLLTDKGAYAVEFAAASQEYIDAPIGENLINSDVTIEAWIKTSTSSAGTVFARGSDSGIILYVKNGKANFGVSSTSFVASTTSVNTGAWVHVAGVLADEAHNHTATTTCTVAAMGGIHVDIYVDGNFEDCAAASYPANIDCSSCANTIARDRENVSTEPVDYFTGIIDEVRLWKEARTASQIATWRQKEITAENWLDANPYNKLAGYWRLNEGSDASATDFSGNGLSGAKYQNDVEWQGGWVAGYSF